MCRYPLPSGVCAGQGGSGMGSVAATSVAAATSHGIGGWLWLAAGLAVWFAGYGVACLIWPYRACRVCSGMGRRPSPSGRAFRVCWWCKGTGRRLRLGRWIYNHWAGLRRDAN